MESPAAVPYSFLERVAEQNSCSTLDTHEPAKSTGKLISWSGKTWVCFSSVGRGHKTLEVMLCEAVPEEFYKGPPNDPGGHTYTGCRLHSKGRDWIMTENVIRLVPSDEAEIHQLKLF